MRSSRQILLIFNRAMSGPSKKKATTPQRVKEMVEAKRSLKISREHLDKSYKVHVGNRYVEVAVIDNMLGYKFGEFAETRKTGPHSRFKPRRKKA